MSRWLVPLQGERFDLEEFRVSFPTGNVSVIEEDGAFYLAGSDFEKCATADKVLEIAARNLDEFTAVILLIFPELRKPTVTQVIREENGKRHTTAFMTARGEGRSKGRATISSPGQSSPVLTAAQELLKQAKGHRHLEAALSTWAEPRRSFPRLYVVLEEIEQHLRESVDKAKLCSANERRSFTQTANTEAAGKDSRHAPGKFKPPKTPMSLAEAAGFVSRMLVAALRKQ